MPSSDYPKCDCGQCHRCKRREISRRYRERHPDRAKAAVRRWREANPDYQKEWRKKNPEKAKEYSARWTKQNIAKVRRAARERAARSPKQPRDPARERERVRRQREKHPERNRVYVQVNYAIRTGKLVRKPCEVCGALEVQAHHEDYTKPLEVRWLCSTHHGQVHWLSA